MIDVKTTVLKTLNKSFDDLRFLGNNDVDLFKKILYLVVLDDLYDWSRCIEKDDSPIQKFLQDYRTKFIICNPGFKVCRFPFDNHYTNVNTEQTIFTWQRVWDNPDVKEIDVEIQPSASTQPTSYIPDPTCPTSIIYYGGEGDLYPSDNDGAPDIDLNTLTICEKMNIYINRDTGQMFFLDPNTCTWKLLKGEFASAIAWENIENKPTIYQGIQHSLGANQLTTELLTEGSSTTSIGIAGEDEIDDVL